MTLHASALARLLACSLLSLGVAVGCGGEDTPQQPPPVQRELPDAERSTVEVGKAQGARANGREAVGIVVTVRRADGAPLVGRTVSVAVSGEGTTVVQPLAPTDAQGLASATVTSTVAGVKTVTATVQDAGGAVALAARPTIEFITLPASRLAFRAAPASGTAGAALGAFEVVLQDSDGEPVPGATGTVTLALGSGPAAAVLEGTLEARAVEGVARFSELVLKKAAQGYTLLASAPGLEGATSPAFEVLPAAAASLVLGPVASPVTAGSAVDLELSAHDAYDNLATGYTGTVRFSSNDAAAVLPADATFSAADAGRKVLPGALTLKQAGPRQVTVTDVASPALSATREVSVVAAAGTRLVFSQPPAQRSVRAPFTVEVALVDDFGNRVVASTPAVSLASNKGTLEGVLGAALVDGVASFAGLSIAQEDTGYTLTASGTGVQPATSAPFSIIDDVPPAAAVLVQGATTPTGMTLTWTAPGDDGAQGTASGYSLRYSTLPIVTEADFEAATAVALGAPQPAGATESVTLTSLTQGTNYYVALRVTDNSGNATRSATLEASTPYPDAAKVVFLSQPGSGTAGQALESFQVAIQSADGLVVTNATSAVTLTVQGVAGYGPFTVEAQRGVATFSNVRIDTAGTGYTLVASSGGLASDTSAAFAIAPASASRLELTGLTAQVGAGVAGRVTVTLSDAFGNRATGYTGTVRFSSTDAQASLPADYLFTASDAGQRSFEDVVLRTSGTQSVTGVDRALATLTDTLTVQVDSTAPSQFVLRSLPVAMTAGGSAEVALEVLDGFGNRATGYTGTVRLTSSDPQATLSEQEYLFTSADAGLKHFTVGLYTAGSQSLTIQDVATPGLTASANCLVEWGPVARLTLDAPASSKAGDPLSVRLTVVDTYGNTVKDYVGSVGFSSTDASATLLAQPYDFTAADEGSRLFSFVLRQAGTTTLTATDAALAVSGSATVAVSAAELSQLVLVTPAGDRNAGASFQVEVSARDAYGNLITDYTGAVSFSSSDARAKLPADTDTTFSLADGGLRSFPVTLETAGEQSLSVRDQANSLLNTSATLRVIAGPPARLVFLSQPQGGPVRAVMAAVRVGIMDAYDNLLPVNEPLVQVGLVGGNPEATLGGTPSATPSAGIATFSDLSVDQQGTGFQLQALGGTLDAASSTAFSVVDGLAPDAAPLTMTGKTSVLVSLGWTAPGDDALSGNASSYELRYSTSPLDETNFASATQVVLDVPQAPGSAESTTVVELTPSTTYHFGLKVWDDAGNASVLSTLSVTTNVDPCASHTCTVPPAACNPDGVSFTTYAATCVDVDNVATCQETQTNTVCSGPDAVCYQGACDTAPRPAANELTLTEVMHSPTGVTTPYVELLNRTNKLLNLNGLTLTFTNDFGTSGSFTVGSGGVPVVLGGNGTFVLARSADSASNGGVSANVAYGSNVNLERSGQLRLSMGTTVVEDFAYTTAFPQTPGKAMSLASLVVGTKANAYSWYWCDSETQLAGGDFGTPNAPNSACGISVAPPVNFCNIHEPKSFADWLEPGVSAAITSRFREPGVTDRNTEGNDYYPHVQAELGYGTDSTNPAGWTWSAASFDSAYVAGGLSDDQMRALLRISVAGSYVYGFRYRFWDVAAGAWTDYAYCDQAGVTVPPAGSYGTVRVSSPASVTSHVVISEVSGRGAGSATTVHTDDFIELYNPTDSPVDLNGWTVQYKSATGTSYLSLTITATNARGGNTFIPARGYFLIAHTNYSGSTSVPANVTHSAFDMSGSTTAGGHVRIGPGLVTTDLSDPKTVDKLGWGTANQPEDTAAPFHPAAGGSLERKAVASSTSSTLATGGIDALRGNGYDSNDNSFDIVTRTTRQPQNTESATERP